ncbi:protein-tyrosine phosphatase [Yamadazyma tenuis]|nr:protein-tyrosine phosphatase [Yamadazyma tenuis]
MAGANDYFNICPQPPSSGTITPKDSQASGLSTPVATQVLETPVDFYPKRFNRVNSHPILHRRLNESASSLASDSTIGDSFFLKSKSRIDSTISDNTLVDDSPSKMALNLPKLSIKENHQFSFTNSPSSPKLASPMLKKYLSSPTIKTFNDVAKKPVQDYIPQILKLGPNIHVLNQSELQSMLAKVQVVKETLLPNLVTIDVRSFTDYAKCHFTNAINICLPSTLLKRPNFSFIRCINSLPIYERMILKTYFNHNAANKLQNKRYTDLEGIPCGEFGYPSILIYDNSNNSYNIYWMIKKILEEFQVTTSKIFVIKDGFAGLLQNQSFSFEGGSKQNFNLDELLARDTNVFRDIVINPESTSSATLSSDSISPGKFRSHPSNEIPNSRQVSPLEASTPILSNFKLPPSVHSTPSFKIRHNEEAIGDAVKLGIDLAAKYKDHLSELPSWLGSQTLDEDNLVKSFNKLELNEKNRLNSAFDIKNNIPLIGAGIEMGYKNRYKDIMIFEHSRVKLVDFEDPTLSNFCDYINASYIDSVSNLDILPKMNHSPFKYIATQGPLHHTIGDFYRCVLNSDIALIVCLTDVWEDGIPKCDPYWNTGVYFSNNNEIKITLIKTEPINDRLVLRNIQINTSVNGEDVTRHVLQVQLLQWADNSICNNVNDLLYIFELRRKLMKQLDLGENNTLVHCSAGCGRTGTFIAIDTILNLVSMNYKFDAGRDLIPLVVDNMRSQRISMVQNLRQYMSVYESLICSFLQHGNVNDRINESQVINDFLNR